MELATLLGGLGTMGLLAIGRGEGREGAWYGCSSWSVAELILTVQRGDLQGTLCILVRASVLLGVAVVCFWFGLRIPYQVNNVLISLIRA